MNPKNNWLADHNNDFDKEDVEEIDENDKIHSLEDLRQFGHVKLNDREP